jgi:hypothetical protein
MVYSNREWLPPYCEPHSFLPSVQETVILFSRPPFLFSDFVGRAAAFLRSDRVAKTGFEFDPKRALPCKWKCSDESLFGVDLCLYAYSGFYPFDKGLIGGRFNEASLGAAVRHSPINVDFGGSHVGYIPGPDGGTFGHVKRQLHDEDDSTDCGYLMALIAPFKQVYDDACKNILMFRPEGEQVMISIPNEFLQPTWSSHKVKLLVDLERLTWGVVPYDVKKAHTHKVAARSLFYVNPRFLDDLPTAASDRFRTPRRVHIGPELTSDTFNIFDAFAQLKDGSPVQRLLPYMKYILSSKVAPYPVKAAVTNANIEYNNLTDAVRTEAFRPHSFASFTGVFIDVYDSKLDSYVNLFQPVGITIKPAGRTREVEIAPEEIHHIFGKLKPARPMLPLKGVLGYDDASHVLKDFSYPFNVE